MRQERVAGNAAHAQPALALVQALGFGAGRIEHQQGFASGARAGLGGLHQRRPEALATTPAVHQQIWVLDGRLEVTVGAQRHTLATGDCLALVLDQPLTYFNPTRKPVRYAVVLATPLNH